jgi:hypothetical protein
MPAVWQPLHLVLGAMVFGTQFHILIGYRMVRRTAALTA